MMEKSIHGGRRKGKPLWTAALFLASLIFSLALLEIGIRFFRPAPLFHQIDISSLGATYTLSENPRLIYVPKPGAGAFNAYGHRGRTWPFERAPGKTRIVFTGDSVVEGLRIRSRDRFTDLIQGMLGDKYEIVNLGVRGYDLGQEIAYLKDLGTRFNPDLVFFCVTDNDLVTDSWEIGKIDQLLEKKRKSGFYSHYYSIQGGMERFLFRFHTYRHLVHFLSPPSGEGLEETLSNENLDRERLGNLVRELKTLSRDKGFRLMVLILPPNSMRYAREMDLLEKILNQERVPTVNLSRMVREMANEEFREKMFFQYDSCHFSRFGHSVMAELIVRIIRELN